MAMAEGAEPAAKTGYRLHPESIRLLEQLIKLHGVDAVIAAAWNIKAKQIQEGGTDG
jgi:hypothetical protein